MPLIVERKFEKVPRIILNRPERNNALSIDLLEELINSLKELSIEDQLRGLIIEGSGGNFCSGLDLKEATCDETIDKGAILIREVFLRLAGFPKPIIASVSGNCFAGGFGIAALSDLIIASKGAKFQFPEVHRGLVPAYLLTVLKHRFPPSLLRAMSLFGYPLSSEEAHDVGLVHFLVEEKDREEKIKEAVSLLMKGAPGAISNTKVILGAIEGRQLKNELLDAEGIHRRSRESDEAREGVAAFFEKRCPNWWEE